MNALIYCSKPCDYAKTCLGSSDLSELKARAFGREKKCEDALKVSEPRYNKKVLHGNWYEERAEYTPPPDKWISSYNDVYKPCEEKQLEPVEAEGESEDNEEQYSIEKNKLRNQGVGPLLIEHHGDAYHNNFSTSYDLSYRVLTKGLKGPRLRTYNARKDTYIPEIDLTRNYGNLYGYGLKEYIAEKAKVADPQDLEMEAKDVMRTSYQCEFMKRELPLDTKRLNKFHLDSILENIVQNDILTFSSRSFPRKHADMNTPDLRHLGIDLNARWSRRFTHGFHRINLSRKTKCG